MSNPPPTRNVIVFGESGAGKGSVINMLGDGEVAPVHDRLLSQPARPDPYLRKIQGYTFSVFDTAGLDSIFGRAESALDPIEGLCNLIRRLPGITLLVYVFRARQMLQTEKDNYDAVLKAFPQGNVRVVIVVTGLENMPDMEQWWWENESVFTDCQMRLVGHACVTAFKGRRLGGGYQFEREYEESKRKVQELIYAFRDEPPFVLPTNSSFLHDFLLRLQRFFVQMFAAT